MAKSATSIANISSKYNLSGCSIRGGGSFLRRSIFRHPTTESRKTALSYPVARGGVGERSAPRSFRRKPKSSPEQPRAPSKTQMSSRTVPSPRRKLNLPTKQPRENSRGSQPARPRRPRGCRGAERPTPVSSETEILTRTAPRTVENSNAQQNSSFVPSEAQPSNRTAPGKRERVATRSHPVTRGGVGERSAPRSFRRKQKSSPERPRAPSETKVSNRIAPGERERV